MGRESLVLDRGWRMLGAGGLPEWIGTNLHTWTMARRQVRGKLVMLLTTDHRPPTTDHRLTTHDQRLERTVHRFYWLAPGILAGCSRPGGRLAWWRREAAVDEDLGWLRAQGIEALLSLTEDALPAGALERHGLAGLHLPVDDLRALTPEQFRRALAFIDEHRATGRAIAVHCLAGQGRTGSVLAAYLIRDGYSAEAALAELRAVCPGAVENAAQEAALAAFAKGREWLI